MKWSNEVRVLISRFIKAAVLYTALDLNSPGTPAAPRTEATMQNFTFWRYLYI